MGLEGVLLCCLAGWVKWRRDEVSKPRKGRKSHPSNDWHYILYQRTEEGTRHAKIQTENLSISLRYKKREKLNYCILKMFDKLYPYISYAVHMYECVNFIEQIYLHINIFLDNYNLGQVIFVAVKMSQTFDYKITYTYNIPNK